MANYVFVAKSLDGFIATKDGSTDWLTYPNPTKTDYGYNSFVSKIDAILMGRKSYEQILMSNKPYPYTKPVFVLSNTLKTVPINLSDSLEIVSGPIPEIVKQLSDRGYNNIYIDGASTIQSFLKEELIDEMLITTVPIILGQGISLFGNLGTEIKFEHTKATRHENGLITCEYKKVQSAITV